MIVVTSKANTLSPDILYKSIILTQGVFTLLDIDDYDYFNVFKWRYDKGYAFRTTRDTRGSRKQTEHKLHRVVYERSYGHIPSGYHIHHKSGYKLDNRKENLECLSVKDHLNEHMTDIGVVSTQPCVLSWDGVFKYICDDNTYSTPFKTRDIAIQAYFQFTLFGENTSFDGYTTD